MYLFTLYEALEGLAILWEEVNTIRGLKGDPHYVFILNEQYL